MRQIEKEKMIETFKSQKSFFSGRVMRRHILKVKKENGKLQKKVGDLMPLEFFYESFRYTIFRIIKLVGVDGTMNSPGHMYIMALDIQDLVHNVGYDFVEYIINRIHDEIVTAQKEELGNFRFFHYLLLMHIIIYKNIGHVSLDFIEATEENGENLPMQLWT